MIDVETARGYYTDGDSAHGFDHVLRVWRVALHLAEEEGADREVVNAAALLHDVGRAEELRTGICHAQQGARMAREILHGQPARFIEAVAEAIAQHRFRGGQEPTTLEARILYDADKLDAIGAIGVARAYAVAGALRQHLWAAVSESLRERDPAEGVDDLNDDTHTPVHEFMFKLRRLAELVVTPTAKRLAAERQAFMGAFFERLAAEVAGER